MANVATNALAYGVLSGAFYFITIPTTPTLAFVVGVTFFSVQSSALGLVLELIVLISREQKKDIYDETLWMNYANCDCEQNTKAKKEIVICTKNTCLE